ncbi:MAG: DUF1848 domain-containing protein [Defluviitaleaceae bacterium]|nr:DUF1848 domain-containing protein [Defluviitaleaceae bacterium]
MIISASRRTDIASYYSDWFFNRIKEKLVYVRNPFNFQQLTKVDLSPDAIDGFVFWTKNPIPMLDRLDELNDYMFYFQITVTPYGNEIEPIKSDKLLAAFRQLSDKLGPNRVIWRYDPILLNKNYTVEYHQSAFNEIAKKLKSYTEKVIISFIDTHYREVKRNIKELDLHEITDEQKVLLTGICAETAREYGFKIDACAEERTVQRFGIPHAQCVDGVLLEKLLGRRINYRKDKNQRDECGCIQSIDIGMYNTCLSGCKYCYANYNHKQIAGNFAKHDPEAAIISGTL